MHCCDVQGHSNGEGMSLVLASLSSAYFTYISKICDTKKCPVSCVQGPLWPLFLVLERRCKVLRVTFLLSAVNYFLIQTYDDTVFQCVVFLFLFLFLFWSVLFLLFVFPNMTPLSLLYKGL